jgi:hypothetical protein
MFNMFKPKPKTTAEQKLEEIKNILFPPFKKQSEKDVTFLIDYSADSNLQAAVTDLEEGYNDEVVQGTITKVIDRLVDVRKILKAYGEFGTDAQYIIVDDLPSEKQEIEVGTERRH